MCNPVDKAIKAVCETQVIYVLAETLPSVEKAKKNGIYFHNGYMYVIFDNHWENIGSWEAQTKAGKKPRHIKIMCSSCGSTNVIYTNGVYKCTYCGTQYIMEE